jgi:hypothetical protein
MNVLLNDLLYLAYFWVLGSISYQAKNSKWTAANANFHPRLLKILIW